jgi:hypothetical protein
VSGKRLMIAFLVFVASSRRRWSISSSSPSTPGPRRRRRSRRRGRGGGEGAEVPVRELGRDRRFDLAAEAAGLLRHRSRGGAEAEAAPDAAPLNAPFWFRCFDARAIGEDLEAGRAEAVALARDEPEGFDLMLAVYPDGRAYLWRQLGERYR